MTNSDEISIPRVTVIGTCRVHHTLRELHRERKIILNNGGLGTFVHSPPEILLRLKVLAGLEEYKPELVKLQVGESEEIKLKPKENFRLTDSDLLLIEISSLKVVFLGDQPLQFNEVNRHLCTPFGAPGKEILASINDSFNKRIERIKLPDNFLHTGYPKESFELIKKLSLKLLDKEDIYRYLDEIRSLAQIPVMFVNHINVPGKNGKLLTSRNVLCQIVEQYSDDNDIVLFEPSKLFNDHDRTKLLKNDGLDIHHYSKDSLSLVGNLQFEKIKLILNNIVE